MKTLLNFEEYRIIKEHEEQLENYLDSMYESTFESNLNENIGAAIGSPVKFTKLKNNAKKYQQALVQKALNNVNFEKKKEAAGGIDKEKMEVLKSANAAKNQALSDKASAISDRMDQLATTDALKSVKSLAKSKAKIAAAETSLKAADEEETKALKIQIKKLSTNAAEQEKAIKDYEKKSDNKSDDEQLSKVEDKPKAETQPKTDKTDNNKKITILDSKIEDLKKDKQTKEGQLNSKNHPDVLAVEVAIKSAELEKAKLRENPESIKSAETALKSAQDDKKTADNAAKTKDDGSDPIASLEKDIADFDKNIETEMATVAKLKNDLDQAKQDVSIGKNSDAEVLKIQKSLDDSNEDLAELKRRKADAKKKINSLQKESTSYIEESVADKFRQVLNKISIKE